MTHFENCMNLLLVHEGGYVNDPLDSGGRTNLGVTQAVYEQFLGRQVTEDEMKSLTRDDVAPVYKKNYWDRSGCDYLPNAIAWMVFDWAVNGGPGRPAKAIQRIAGCKPDGAIGPMTIKAVMGLDKAAVVEKMFEARQKFYDAQSVEQRKRFGKGWARRNTETFEQAMKML